MTLTVSGATALPQLDPQLAAGYEHHYYVRHSSAPGGGLQITAQNLPAGSPAWEARRVGGAPDAGLGTAGSPPVTYQVHKPRAPEAIRVRCSCGTENAEATIWFVEATVRITPSGNPPGNGNPAWASQVLPFVTNAYSLASGSLGTLGLFQVTAGSGANRVTRYGRFTEIVATFAPRSFGGVPIRVFLARRVVSSTLQAVDSSGAALPDARGLHTRNRSRGENDTSHIFENVAGSARMTPQAQIFDYDLPGSVMSAANLAGDVHRWNVTFEQAALIGRPNDMGDAMNRGMVASAWVQWRANYSATCTRPGTPPTVNVAQGR